MRALQVASGSQRFLEFWDEHLVCLRSCRRGLAITSWQRMGRLRTATDQLLRRIPAHVVVIITGEVPKRLDDAPAAQLGDLLERRAAGQWRRIAPCTRTGRGDALVERVEPAGTGDLRGGRGAQEASLVGLMLGLGQQ